MRENRWSRKVWEDAKKSTGRREKSVDGSWLEIFEGRRKKKRVAQQNCKALVLEMSGQKITQMARELKRTLCRRA